MILAATHATGRMRKFDRDAETFQTLQAVSGRGWEDIADAAGERSYEGLRSLTRRIEIYDKVYCVFRINLLCKC